MSVQGQQVLVNLTIAEDGDGLGGTWAGPVATNTLSDVNFDGDSLSFSMQTQGSLNVSFDLEDNMLNGSLSTPMGNLPIVGRKSSNIFDFQMFVAKNFDEMNKIFYVCSSGRLLRLVV